MTTEQEKLQAFKRAAIQRVVVRSQGAIVYPQDADKVLKVHYRLSPLNQSRFMTLSVPLILGVAEETLRRAAG